MEKIRALTILSDEREHTISHLAVAGKDPEYYLELGELAEAMRMSIEALQNATEPAEWVEVNYDKVYDGGMRLRFNGWRCSNCGFERHKRRGMSKHCEECGAKMKGGAEE